MSVGVMTMSVGSSFALTFSVAMRMTSFVRMAVLMALAVFRGFFLRRPVPAEVMMIMAMRGRSDYRFWNAALFTQLCFRRHFVIILSATSLLVSDKPFQGWFIHVTGKGNLRILHTQWARVPCLLRGGLHLICLPSVSSGSDGECGNRARCFPSAVRTRLLFGRIAKRGQQLESEIAR